MSNSETQNDELLALQSIYDEKCFVVEHRDPPCGRFSAHVQLSKPFCIKLKNLTSTNNELKSDSFEAKYEKFEVSYLPPINLHFEYPKSYPSDSPPAFLLSCSWLSFDQLSKLCKHLDFLWDESDGEVILFQWIQFLKDETLNFLQIEECLDITELSKYKLKVDIVNTLSVDMHSFNKKCVISDNKNSQNIEGASVSESQKNPMGLLFFPKPSISGGNGFRDCRAFLDIADGKVLRNMLRDYNEFKTSEEFSESWHLCDICCLDKLGSDFVTFRVCHHFFCRDCVKSYFELMIDEGNVNSLNCLFDKCSTQADGTLVKQIVSKDHFERYDLLLLSRTLDTMSDIAYCPRKACQCPLLIDVSGRIGTCPACKFVFCPFCKVAYHGVAPCRFDPALKKQICQDYLKGDAFRKAEIENRHGKRIIKSLVEEVLSEEWLGSNSKPCPHCNASIEKTEGCNKMTCFKCGTYFCWLCGKQLSPTNPYMHYSERGSDCYERLFPPYYVDEGLFMFEPGEFLNF